MDIEKVYEEVDRLTEELTRMNATDENYRYVRENIQGLSQVAGDYEKRDQDRMTNNARTDIQEEQLRVDMAKVKADKWRTAADFFKGMCCLAGSLYLGKSAYDGEMVKFVMPNRGLLDWCKNLFPKR